MAIKQRNRFKEAVLGGLLKLFGRLPLCVHHFNSGWIGFLIRKVVRYRTGIVEENLRAAFPSKSDKEIQAIKKAFYRHMADIIVETIWFGACSAKRLRRSRIVEIVNPDTLNSLYEKSPSVMNLYSHAGNWELLGGIASYNYSGTPSLFTERNFVVVYLQLHDLSWDALLRRSRTAPLHDPGNFEGYIESRNIVMHAFRNRSKHLFYNVNTDQRPYFNSPDLLTVDFLHRECTTMTGAAALAHKFGMAVVYQRMACKKGGGYTIEYVPICPDASQMEVGEIMRQYYRLLEADIEAQPANYLWTHKRWLH